MICEYKNCNRDVMRRKGSKYCCVKCKRNAAKVRSRAKRRWNASIEAAKITIENIKNMKKVIEGQSTS